MPRTLGAVVGISGLVGVCLVCSAAENPTATPTPQPAAAQPDASTPSEGTVVHTFEDEAKMQEFARLWQQRQGVMLRMSVLNAYWTEEQAALAQVNQQMSEAYHVDMTKSYTLDTEQRWLLERPVSPAQPGQPAQPQAPTALPSTEPAQP